MSRDIQVTMPKLHPLQQPHTMKGMVLTRAWVIGTAVAAAATPAVAAPVPLSLLCMMMGERIWENFGTAAAVAAAISYAVPVQSLSHSRMMMWGRTWGAIAAVVAAAHSVVPVPR